ncbi:MAG: hypothetical protein IPK14_26725 [Blastocatellia bacterium]|nr:hypothetical protein [Blastocatellia bacterium]MBL8193449.1 hypothetical protein [Blastocatellia bacterium]MBN8723548.1 hypothetical protein [Acidobacteriota bacterium]
MIKKLVKNFSLLVIAILLTITLLPSESLAQRGRDNDRNDYRRYEQRYAKRDVSEIIRRVEEGSDRFRQDLDRDLDRSRLDGSKKEDRINEDVKRFEDALDRLRREFDRNDSWWESRNNVQAALDSARPVATRMRNNPFSPNVQNQWRNLRRDLNKLAFVYNLPQV